MTDREKIAFKILASLYPDERPSKIRKIIKEALDKDVNDEDIELWGILTKEKEQSDEKEIIKEKIIEHHYHDYWHGPYWYNYCNNTLTDTNPNYKITCGTTSISTSDYITPLTTTDAIDLKGSTTTTTTI